MHSTPEVANIWESELGGRATFCHGSAASRGVAIFFKRGFAPEIRLEQSHREGRFLLMDVVLKEAVYSIGSIYAPTQDRSQDQIDFHDTLEEALGELEGVDIVLGGDFNCIFSPTFDKNSSSPLYPTSDAYRSRLTTIMEDLSLCDLWRSRFPDRKGFKFRRGGYSSRLDLFVVSSHLSEGVINLKTKVVAQSDHSIILMEFSNPSPHRGPGLWRFDSTLLSSQKFVMAMSDFLKDWEAPPELQDPCSIWEWQKHEIQTFVMKFKKGVVSQEKQLLSSLQAELEDLVHRADDGESLVSEIESVKRELHEMEDSRANKLIFRSRVKWAHLGEKPSSYFLNLQKRKLKEKSLSTIVMSSGDTLHQILLLY